MADSSSDKKDSIKLVNELIASRLTMLRMERGESLIEVAEKTGVSISSISNYERGIRQPDFYALYKLSEYYNVSVDWLIGRDKRR